MANNEKNTCSPFKTSVGGQALIEGIMMRGPFKSAMAVRQPDGEIKLDVWNTKVPTGVRKIPFLRGIFNFVDTLIQGYKCLMKAADIAGQAEEPDKFELWLDKHFGNAAGALFGGLATVLALIITILLFIIVPASLVKLLTPYIGSQFLLTVIEGVLKICIFLAYIIIVSKQKDVARVFMYHGAEHKTIACYEAGDELTVENVRKYRRFHPRCGTSFILIVLIISILVTSVVTWDSLIIRVLLKIALLPVVVGISYEIIKFAGRSDSALAHAISAPGLWLQRFTTSEPDDSMIECAIAAVTPCLPENKEEGRW